MVRTGCKLDSKKDEILAKYKAGTSAWRLAVEYGVTTPTILKALRVTEPGIQIRKKRVMIISKDILEKAMAEGKFLVDIADENKASVTTVRHAFQLFFGKNYSEMDITRKRNGHAVKAKVEA